jgi:PKD repeat protein
VTSVEEFATGWSGVELTTTPDADLAYVSFGDGIPGTGSVRKVVYTPGNLSPNASITASATAGPPPLAVQFTGSNSTDPDGDALSYRWDFGDGSPVSTHRDPSHTYGTPGNYTARLTVSDGRGLSDTQTVTIAVGGAPPVASIDSPATGARYRAGQTIDLRGSATDAQDGGLPASAMSWTVRLYHGSHIHIVRQVDGQATPSFVVQDDHDADSHYEITLTVTDSGGLRGSHTIRLDPETVNLGLESTPAGAALSYSSAALTAPGSFTSGVGSRTTVGAVQQFTSGGREYVFDRWSDGGPASTTTWSRWRTRRASTYRRDDARGLGQA